MKVYIVLHSSYEGDFIRFVCVSEETAIKRWTELRDEMIKDYPRYADELRTLKPGEEDPIDCDDYPNLRTYEAEE